MSRLVKRTVTEVTFMESTSRDDDVRALYQTAKELWSQGDIVVKGEAVDDSRGTRTEMIDSAKDAFAIKGAV